MNSALLTFDLNESRRNCAHQWLRNLFFAHICSCHDFPHDLDILLAAKVGLFTYPKYSRLGFFYQDLLGFSNLKMSRCLITHIFWLFSSPIYYVAPLCSLWLEIFILNWPFYVFHHFLCITLTFFSAHHAKHYSFSLSTRLVNTHWYVFSYIYK